jgi:hypothetical protein
VATAGHTYSDTLDIKMSKEDNNQINSFRISKLTKFQTDSKLYSQILDILKESYENPIQLIERAYKNNQDIFLCYDSDVLCGFFMVGTTMVNEKQIIYLGLSGVLSSKKGLGIGKLLYKTHLDELVIERQKTDKKIICWATTASIGVFYALKSLYKSISPNENLTYEQDDLDLVKQICKIKNIEAYDYFPFLAKGIALNTNYSKTETERLQEFTLKNNSTFFEKIGLDERAGDRLILILNVQ